MKRFYVDPIDNCGSVAGLVRDRTWAVMDRRTGKQVSEHGTRRAARADADALETVGEA